MSDYFSVSGNPATGALGASADIRAEFALVSDGFDKLPDLTTVANRVVHVNSGSTALVTTSGFTFDGTTFTAPALAVTNASTFTGAVTCNGTVTLGNAAADNITVTGTITSNLIFTDATYDIGASGATRPRNYYGSGTITVGGTISTVGGSLDVDSDPDTNAYAIDAADCTKQLTDGASANLGSGNNFYGLIMVTETQTTGESALFICGGNAVMLVSETGTQWANTDLAGAMCIYASASTYVLKNNNGGTRTFGVAMIRTRTEG